MLTMEHWPKVKRALEDAIDEVVATAEKRAREREEKDALVRNLIAICRSVVLALPETERAELMRAIIDVEAMLGG